MNVSNKCEISKQYTCSLEVSLKFVKQKERKRKTYGRQINEMFGLVHQLLPEIGSVVRRQRVAEHLKINRSLFELFKEKEQFTELPTLHVISTKCQTYIIYLSTYCSFYP